MRQTQETHSYICNCDRFAWLYDSNQYISLSNFLPIKKKKKRENLAGKPRLLTTVGVSQERKVSPRLP